MPEGDTIFRTAVVLRKVLSGKAITQFETSLEAVAAVIRRRPVEGRVVMAVESRGKNLLMVFRSAADAAEAGPSSLPIAPALGLDLRRSDLVLRTHLRMTGSWHVYRPGEAWRKPARYASVTLYTDEFVVPCFSAPVVELLTAREAALHRDLAQMGPDAISQDFDAEETLRRMRSRPDLEISVALMNQRQMAGVGNEFKSEILFICRVSPFLKVRELDDERLMEVIQESHRLLTLNRTPGPRRTRFALDGRQRTWVYGRSGEPCRVCGEPIRMRRQGLDARSTYFCHRCQQTPDFPR